MKLNSKTLKSLIVEVIEEMKRRDFLKRAGGLAGTAALGYSLYNDKEENPLSMKDKYRDAPMMTRQDAIDAGMNPDEFFPPEGQSYDDKEQFPLEPIDEDEWKEPKAPYTAQQGKYALDQLRVTPENLRFYTVAPAQSNTADSYVYVDMGSFYELAEKNPELIEHLDVAEAYYNSWNLKEHYEYVFGKLVFWGTFKDPNNPLSRKLAPSFPGKNTHKQDINNVILPLAWTVSLEYWMNRFLSLESRLQQHPNNTSDILDEAGLSVDEYYEMKARYENTVSRVSNPSIVDNPNYKSEEEK